MKNWLNFGGHLGILRMSKWAKKNTIIVVAYPGCGAGNDPKLFFGGVGGGESFTTKAQHFYSKQYGTNDLPRPRRSVLSECF